MNGAFSSHSALIEARARSLTARALQPEI